MHQQTSQKAAGLTSPANSLSATSLAPKNELWGHPSRLASAPQRPHHPCLHEIDLATKIVVGNAGDHSRVQTFLTQYYQTPLGDDFQSRLDEPSYEPSDRMLLIRHGQLIGHVQLSRQSAWFESERIPLAAFRDFVVLSEMQSAGYQKPLLETAEATALAEGAVLGIARPTDSELFAERDWIAWRAQGHTQANTRALLAHITAQLASRKARHSHVEIRTWLHFELEAIQPVYERAAAAMWGTLLRNDDAWRWLVGRKAHDQILMAIRHKSDELSDSSGPNVVGYAVVRDSCIVEMMTLPGHSVVRAMLVARACRDAIDRDHHFVSLHTPPTDPLHELLVTAGGSWHPATPYGGQWMTKLLSAEKWIERLYPLLYQRARETGIPRPLEIGFAVGDERYRLVFTRRSARLEHALPSAEVNVACDAATFQSLLLGNLNWPTAVERGIVKVDDSRRSTILAVLFPPRLFWQSPFELLRL